MKRAKDQVTLLALGEQLHGARRQVERLKRRAGDNAQAWQQWSTAIEDMLSLVSRIGQTPPRNLRGVSVKLEAVIWLLTHDDAIVDAGAERQLRALGREVRALTGR